MSVVTTSASIFGYTPNYAPLEQVQGLGTDPRSDIYALAATLFHLITNTKPPDALSRASAIINGLPDPLLPANQVTPQVSGAVADVLAKGMSQKRDDRFATANAMRDALRAASGYPLGAAETVLTGAAANANAGSVMSERATQIVGDRTSPLASPSGSEAQTLVAADATNIPKPTSVSETATIIRPASGARGMRMWLGAGLLLVLIVGGAGGFYAYRARRQAQQNATPTVENPDQPSGSDQPASGSPATSGQVGSTKTNESNTEKKAETSQRAGNPKQSADKTETTNPTTGQSGLPPSTAHDAERNPDRNPNPAPSPQNPPFDPSRNPRQPGRPPGRGEAPSVRTMPNGTRIVTQPDGTRVVTLPNGGVRVIPPGEKPGPRRRNRP